MTGVIIRQPRVRFEQLSKFSYKLRRHVFNAYSLRRCRLQAGPYLRPSFAPLTYEESKERNSMPPSIYRKWLDIDTFFMMSNRQYAQNFENWSGTWRDIEFMSARARQDLRSLAIKELDYRFAVIQLLSSRPHERALRQHIASMHLGEYQIEEYLLPFRRVGRELETAMYLISSAPPHIRDRLHGIQKKLNTHTWHWARNIEHLSEVLAVRLQGFLSNDALQHARTLYKVRQTFERAREKLEETILRLRRPEKQTRSGPDPPSLPRRLEQQLAKTITTSTVNAADLDSVRRYVEDEKTRVLDQHPARWIPKSFTDNFEDVVRRNGDLLCAQLYTATQFSKPEGFVSLSGLGLRYKAHTSFRRLLDRQMSDLPRPYAQKGNDDQDLYTLVRELQWIREYRIEKFPESVSDEEINLARAFRLEMRDKAVIMNPPESDPLARARARRRQKRAGQHETRPVDSSGLEKLAKDGDTKFVELRDEQKFSHVLGSTPALATIFLDLRHRSPEHIEVVKQIVAANKEAVISKQWKEGLGKTYREEFKMEPEERKRIVNEVRKRRKRMSNWLKALAAAREGRKKPH